jgi:hypothetical protein
MNKYVKGAFLAILCTYGSVNSIAVQSDKTPWRIECEDKDDKLTGSDIAIAILMTAMFAGLGVLLYALKQHNNALEHLYETFCQSIPERSDQNLSELLKIKDLVPKNVRVLINDEITRRMWERSVVP